jgi:hypothetical protein
MSTTASAMWAEADLRREVGTGGVELLGGLGDLLGLVTDPFEVGDGLLNGAHHAQVDRGGLALGDHLVAGFVELDLEEVDPVVVLDDLIDQQQIAAVRPSMAFTICSSTMPPICSTRVRMPSSSASNFLEVCSFMVKSVPQGCKQQVNRAR